MHNIIQTVFYRGCGTNQLPNNESEYQRQKTKLSGAESKDRYRHAQSGAMKLLSFGLKGA